MPKPARILGAAMILASVGALAVSIPAMARQIRASNAGRDLPFFGTRSPPPDALPFVDGVAVFAWGVGRGTAPVAMTLADEGRTLDVEYRGESRAVPITGAIDERLPGFARFRDGQLKLVVISEERPGAPGAPDAPAASGAPSDEARDADPLDRLILAVRVEREVRPDEDPSEMAGVVDRKAWRYEFLEFAPVGVETGGPMIRVHEIAYADLPEWERTWQYAAALNVTPPLRFPKLKDPMSSNRGLNGVTWPFPVAALAVLGAAAGFAVLGGTFVHRDDEDADAPGGPETGGKSGASTRANA